MKITYKEIQELKSKYDNNVVLHLNKCSIVKKCNFCGNYYTATHHRQVYCCKECSKKALQDQKNKWKREKWVRPAGIGTGYITETRNEDFEKEHEILTKELRRLKIR